MGTFGERLRREREMRGVSLDEIAAATKIGTRSLKALENEDFSKLPGGIFNKGFVRAYARFLGMNEDQAVADYVAAAGEAEQNSDLVMQRLAAESERREDEKRIERARAKSVEPPFTWNSVAIVVVLAVAAVLGWQYYARHKALRAQQNTIPAATPSAPLSNSPTETPAASATTPAGMAVPGATTSAPDATRTQEAANPTSAMQAPTNSTSSAQPGSASPSTAANSEEAGAQGFVVTVKVKDAKQSWVASLADNKSKSAKLLAANSEATFRARSNLRLTIGNAGGVEISFNGKPLPAIGDENQSKTLVFTPEGPQQ